MKKKRTLMISSAVVLVLGVVGYGLFQISKARDCQLFGTLVHHGNTSQKVVALTFDDAPTAQTPAVLKMLATENVQATFYVVGQNAEKYPNQLHAIVNQGHEVGNHSYSHQRMVLKTPGFVSDEIEKTNALIRASGYAGPITFRPPYGKKLFVLPWYLWHHNMTTVMWDVEPDTYYSDDTNLTNYTLAHTTPGSIIVMHPFCETKCAADREALPHIIEGLKAKGYQFVTVSTLMEHTN